MANNLAPVIKFQEFDSNGDPLAGGLLYSYAAGTSTPQATYFNQTTDPGSANENPVELDADGRADVWLDPTLSYKFVLKDSDGNTLYTVDNVIGLLTNDAVPTASLQNLSVTRPKIALDAVGADQLADSVATDGDRAVTTNHIRNENVTLQKLAASVFSAPTNLGLSVSMSANAVTIAIKDAAGSDPSATSPVKIPVRSSTASSGAVDVRSVTAALSVSIASGATAGTRSAIQHRIYIYAIDNAGTIELAFSRGGYFGGSIVSTTAAAGAANAGLIYSTTARANVPCTLIGEFTSTQATAGTWATTPSSVSVAPYFEPKQFGACGASNFPGTASATLSRTNAAFGSMGAVAAWPAPTIECDGIGNWETTDADLPRQTITNLPPGVYVAEFHGVNVDPSTTGVAKLTISDGSTTSGFASISENGTNTVTATLTVSGTFVYTTTQASVSFELWGASSAGAIAIDNTDTLGRVGFRLTRSPVQ